MICHTRYTDIGELFVYKMLLYSDGDDVRSDTPGSLWEGSLDGVLCREESKSPTLSFCSAANDSLVADMASKNRVQDAKATGMGRSISWKRKVATIGMLWPLILVII